MQDYPEVPNTFVASALYNGARDEMVPFVTQPPQAIRMRSSRGHRTGWMAPTPGPAGHPGWQGPGFAERSLNGPRTDRPHYPAFCAPTNDGAMLESDFDRASKLAMFPELTAPSSLAGEVLSTLDIDVKGRIDDFANVLLNNAMCLLLKLVSGIGTLCAVGEILQICLCNHCKPQGLYLCPGMSVTDSTAAAQVAKQIRDQAQAHHLTLREGCVVYTRDAHKAMVLKNWATQDQYGINLPAVGYGYESIGALTVHVPLSEASFSLVPLSDLVGDLPGSTLSSTYERSTIVGDCGACLRPPCLSSMPKSAVLVLRAGSAVQVTVACVEVGPGSNVDAFLAAFESAKGSALAGASSVVDPAWRAEYDAWFLKMLQKTGTMAGASPGASTRVTTGDAPAPKRMQRTPNELPRTFLKEVGPLPAGRMLGVQWVSSWTKQGYFTVGSPGCTPISCVITKRGEILQPTGGVSPQLHTGDYVVAINGVSMPRKKLKPKKFAEQVAASPSGVMQILTRTPHYQPNAILDINVPSDAVGKLGLLGTPPTVRSPGPAAAAHKVLPGDIVVQWAIDGGITCSATQLSAEQLVAEAAKAKPQGSLRLVLLQPALTPAVAGRTLPFHGQPKPFLAVRAGLE